MLRSLLKPTFVLFAGFLLLSACNSSKKATTVSRNAIKGTWTLGGISFQVDPNTLKNLGPDGGLRIKLLDEGTKACLQGSVWVLPNNGYGSYTISQNQQGCVPGQKNIIWSYRTEDGQPIFQFKKLEGGVKAKDITDGYRFKIISADDKSMRLESEITYEGKPIQIEYLFNK